VVRVVPFRFLLHLSFCSLYESLEVSALAHPALVLVFSKSEKPPDRFALVFIRPGVESFLYRSVNEQGTKSNSQSYTDYKTNAQTKYEGHRGPFCLVAPTCGAYSPSFSQRLRCQFPRETTQQPLTTRPLIFPSVT
jgi:hypothetical protein